VLDSTRPGWRNGALLASVAAAALLALVATWTAALARVPQQRAAVERLLQAQTGLDVRYGRLVLRLGFYGPEAEFSDLEMRRPGAEAPLLRAPRMLARFESWRLLRGGQLRPGRVLVSGAEIDLRQLATLRRAATRDAATPGGTSAQGSLVAQLEARLPALLEGIPEGSLDFEAATLVWTDPARPAAPLLLRAPRLYASRRIDGAQLSGTLLLPTRLGRTFFVTTQLRNGERGAGLSGRLRLSGRGLVLASWREFGLLPAAVTGGSGDVALSVQLANGRIQQAEGSARLAGLGLRAPLPLVARRFALAAAQFSFLRQPDGLRYRLQQVELRPVGATTPTLGERGALEVLRGAGGEGQLLAQHLPIEAVAMVARLAALPGDGAPQHLERAAPAWRVTAGEVLQLESRWGAGDDPAVADSQATLAGLQVESDDGAWRVDGIGATLQAAGPRWQLALEGRELDLRSPWFATQAEPVRVTLAGRVTFATAPQGWSLAVPQLDLEFARGPALRLAGSAGLSGQDDATGAWRLQLTAPLRRADMGLLETALGRWAPPAFWSAFTAGELEAGSADLDGDGLQAVQARLRGAAFAAAPQRPEVTALDADLAWDGPRLDGQLLGGRVGGLTLERGRVSTTRPLQADAPAELAIDAQLRGPLPEAVRLAAADGLPGVPALELSGQARLDARLRVPATGAAGRGLELAIDVEDARWQPLAEAAPLSGLRGRLRADGRGLRDGRLEGRWLDGPVQLRLEAASSAGLRLQVRGRLPAASLEREWTWIDLVDRARDGALEWSADLRRERDDDAPGSVRGAWGRGAAARGARVATDEPATWRMRVAVPGSALAELRWTPGAGPGAPWRIDRGTVTLGDAPAVAGIPGALVVGGRVGRLELAGLAGALARIASSAGWQRPLVGEVAVADLRLGDGPLGTARLRVAGSRESTTVDLFGESLAGELRQLHAEPGRLQASFARLQLPAAGHGASLVDALLPLQASLRLQVADLQRDGRSLGALDGLLEADGAVLSTRDLTLRRGAQRAVASGRCERATTGCRVDLQVADADLAGFLRDLGAAPSLRGREVAVEATLGWSFQPGRGLMESLQGEVGMSAILEGEDPAGTSGVDDAATAPPPWPPLAPLLAVANRQAIDQQAARLQALTAAPARADGPALAPSLAFERLEWRLAIRDGIGEIERYEAIGRDARLSVAGRFDFGRGTLEQQAQWYWIAPGVAGAVERLDPRSPLAATLRTMRELLGASRAAADQPGRGAGAGRADERFALSGPAAQPVVERLPLLDSPP
jgi:hypothetical protein